MALGFGIKKTPSAGSNSDTTKKPEEFQDAEKGVFEGQDGGRRASRIEGVARRDMSDGDGASVSIGKQIELEAGNAIQYRTCSWQKVRLAQLTVLMLPRC